MRAYTPEARIHKFLTEHRGEWFNVRDLNAKFNLSRHKCSNILLYDDIERMYTLGDRYHAHVTMYRAKPEAE